MIARVVIDIKHRDINRTFDYFISQEHMDIIKIGMRVLVPFTVNDIQRQALVVDLIETSPYAEKYITEILDIDSIIDEEIFLILNYLLKNPSTLIAKAVETIIPHDLIQNYQKKVILLNDEIKEEFKRKFNKKNEWVLKTSDQVYYQRLKTLAAKGFVEIKTILKPKVATKHIEYIELNRSNIKLTQKQQDVIQVVKNYSEITKRYLTLLTSSSIVNALIKKDVLQVVLKEETLNKEENLIKIEPIELTKNEMKIFDKITKPSNIKDYLINAFNDSTLNIINKLIEKNIIDKKQTLILVPERFLVAKYEDYFQKKFLNELVTTLDSLTTPKQRYLNKKAILDNESLITVGTRLSVFAKFNDLGLVIALQSDDTAYLADDGIFYDTLEVLKIKAHYNDATFLQVTNAMTLKQAKALEDKKLKLIDFTDSHEKEVIVDIVDMKNELLRGNTKMFSQALKTYMDASLNKNERILLIMNQKGFAPFVMCRSCSYVPKDKETDIPLNYSEKENILRSNITKYQEVFSKTCPICHKDTMKAVGSGIEQLESYLKKVYPKVPLLRIDSDTLSNKEVYEIADELDDSKDNQIIIGTQMALKDIFAKKINLVGILMADQFLRIPKFDAAENAYNLLSHAKHIAENRLVIQTYQPNHDVIQAVKGITDFYKIEMQNRLMSHMPPFVELLQVSIESTSYLKTYQYAFHLKEVLQASGIKVLGPTQSNVLKNDKQYRFLLLLKCKSITQEIKDILKSQKEYVIQTNPYVIWY